MFLGECLFTAAQSHHELFLPFVSVFLRVFANLLEYLRFNLLFCGWCEFSDCKVLVNYSPNFLCLIEGLNLLDGNVAFQYFIACSFLYNYFYMSEFYAYDYKMFWIN